jgi:hypothetical protein
MRRQLLLGAISAMILCCGYSMFNRVAADRIDVQLVAINVSVTDANSGDVSDLSMKSFAIAEDGVNQVAEPILGKGAPVSLILAFQTANFEAFRPTAQRVAANIARQIRQDDDVVAPQLEIARATDFPPPASGQRPPGREVPLNDKTPLNDVIAAGVRGAGRNARQIRKAAIVITDGLGLGSGRNDRDVAHELLRENIPIYFIRIDNGTANSRREAGKSIRQSMSLLTRVAEISGGQTFVVNYDTGISARSGQILRRMNHQYVICYYSTNEKLDGAFHRLRVTLKDGGRDLKINAPEGRYARVIADFRDSSL